MTIFHEQPPDRLNSTKLILINLMFFSGFMHKLDINKILFILIFLSLLRLINGQLNFNKFK